ncbi:MAG: hypothetical protein JWO57_1701 [Pseudonocardiales bacterium]|jgi:hypothetical protein|nr:hypothetical protein [Pseudonocardiales bacterium]
MVDMRIGGSLFLIALGAILKFAVTAHVKGLDLQAMGVILMIVGAVGLAITLTWMSMRRRTDVIEHTPAGHRGTTYVTPNDPLDGPL